MSSTRIYLAPGRCLRLRQLPRAPLTRYTAHSHITKNVVRSCSGWRRNGPYWYRDYGHTRRQQSDQQNKDKLRSEEQFAKDDSPYEPSRREKMWQERMERIRRMVDHDPYEALFGYSNRLLRGMRIHMPPDASGPWWRREMSFTIRNPLHGSKMADQKPNNQSETADEPSTKSHADTQLKYDPISGRMIEVEVEKSSKAPAHAMSSAKGGSVNVPIKPYRPHPDTIESAPRSPPSFTMLKEDLPQEPVSQPSKEPEPISSARAEYEQYKAKRLRDAEKTSRWLESEGFRDTQLDSSKSTLEKSFDDVHSGKQELLEEKTVDKRPWSAQRSFGTTVPSPPPIPTSGGSTFASWREKAKVPAYDEAKADREIHDYTMRVAGDNLKNKQAIDQGKLSKSEYGLKPGAKIVHPTVDAQAEKEIREYATRVASGNIKTRRFAEEQKAKASTEVQLDVLHAKQKLHAEQIKKPAIVHPPEDMTARKDIQDYASSVVGGNASARRLAEEQKIKQAKEEAFYALRRKQFEDFNKESVRIAKKAATQQEAATKLGEVKSTILDAKARLAQFESHLAEKPASSLQTSLQRHQDRSAVATQAPLKTSLQRLNNTTSEVVLKPDQSLLADSTDQVRTHDPVGYNHNRESKHLQKLTSTKKPFRVPSLAEVFGYKKDMVQDDRDVGRNEIDPSAQWLLGEIETQKQLYSKFESSRKEPETGEKTTETLWEPKSSITGKIAKEIEQKRQDAALVREIRHIYEDKYGPITTSHTQPKLAEVTKEAVVEIAPEPIIETPSPFATPTEPLEKVIKPIVEPESAARPRSSPKVEVGTEPPSTLSMPTPSKTAKYTILAYDQGSKQMTTATFDSIPAETEKAIPATIALCHLAYANRFLHKLIELQHRGFVPVHAERNLLILRQDAGKASPVVEAAEEDPVQSERFVDLGAENTTKKVERNTSDRVVLTGREAKERMSAEARERAWKKWKEQQKQERNRRRRRVGCAVRFVAGGVVLSAGVVYLAGVGAEVRQNRGRGKVVITGDERR